MGSFANNLGGVFVDIDGDLSKLQATLRRALPEAQRAGEEIGKAVAQGTRVTSVGEYFSNLGGALQNFRTVASQALQDLQKLTPGLDRLGASATSLGTKLSVGVTLPLVGLATASIKAAADMDALERGLVAVTGSAAEAERQLAEMREVAKLPGLGLKEAVQGSINLQALGFSADKTKNILLAFGNALATVGRGKEDLNEVIRQLGQLGARGVVTMDNLRPIIERVPQVAAIIKKEFGAEALSDPAKRFKELGISAEQFIDVLVRETLKLPKVTSSLKNDLENFQQALFESFAKIGKELTPFVSEFTGSVVPALKTAIDIFSALPAPVKTAAITVGILSAALGPLIGTVGQVSAGISSTIKLLGIFATSATNAAAATTALNTAVGASGAASSVGLLARILTPTNILLVSLGAAALVTAANLRTLEASASQAFDKGFAKLTPEEAKQFTDRLKSMGLSVEQFKDLSLADLEKIQAKFRQFEDFKAPVTGFTVTLQDAAKAVNTLGDAHDKAGSASDKHAAKAVYGATTFERFTVAAASLSNAFRDIPVTIPLITDLPPELDIARERMNELREETQRAHEVLGDLNNADLSALGDEFDRAADRFGGFLTQVIDAKDVLHDLTVGSERDIKAIGGVFEEAARRQKIIISEQRNEWGQLQDEIVRVGKQASNFLAGGIAVSIVGFDRNAFNRQLDEQTNDQQRALSEREAEHAEHVKKLTAQLNEIVKKNRGRVTQEELDVREALKRENEDYEKFRATTSEKLEQIRQQHRTAWGDIGEAFHQMTIRAAEDLLQILIRRGLDLVLDKLGDILKMIPVIGNSWKTTSQSIGTGATPSFSGAPIPGIGSGAGGGAGSAAGAAGSGVAGIVTAAASVGTLISSVVGNFQFAHMNTALGRIEESTRYLKIGFLDGEQAVQPNVFRLWQLSNEATKSYWGFTVPTMTRMLTELEGIKANTRGGIGGQGNIVLSFAAFKPEEVLEVVSTALKGRGYKFAVSS